MNGDMLIYIFCNGFKPEPDLCSILILTWVIQDYSGDEFESVSGTIFKSEKYAFSIPRVPVEAWEEVVKITAVDKIIRMHEGKRKMFMLFEKKKYPTFPDALLAVIFDPDQKDFEHAKEMFELKEL
jgi:hypothetical protein